MNTKHNTASLYDPSVSDACEQVLVTLLRAFGSLKQTVRLVGGLVPRYLVTQTSGQDVPPHVGTTDVDVVLNVTVLATEGYDSLKQQLVSAGFTRHSAKPGTISSWQWEYRLNEQIVVVEFLQHTDLANPAPRISPIDGEDLGACLIQHAAVAHDWFGQREITVDLPDGNGRVRETIHHADVVAFIVLKALAFSSRHTRKDAADLLYVMQYWGTGHEDERSEQLITEFCQRIQSGEHSDALQAALKALDRHFRTDEGIAGHEKDGPSCWVEFHSIGRDDQEERILEARRISSLVTIFLEQIEQQTGHSFRT